MSTVAQAQQLAKDFEAGVISAGEYKELLEDLKHTAAVEESAGDLAKLTEIHNVLEGLKAASGLV